MSNANIENILFQNEEPWLDRDEVTAGMGLIVAGLLDKIFAKADELGASDDTEVSETAAILTERMLILGNGIRRKPKRTKLYSFNERLKDSYELGSDAIDKYVHDKYRLVTMIDRIGNDIQGNMIVNGLLTEKAKRQLDELKPKVVD